MVAGWSVDRSHGDQGWRDPALPDAGLGRADAAIDDRLRADAPPLFLARRQVDLHPAEPSQRLPRPGGGRPARAGNALPRSRAFPRGADNLSRRQVPRLLPRERRLVAVAHDARRTGAMTLPPGA